HIACKSSRTGSNTCLCYTIMHTSVPKQVESGEIILIRENKFLPVCSDIIVSGSIISGESQQTFQSAAGIEQRRNSRLHNAECAGFWFGIAPTFQIMVVGQQIVTSNSRFI